MKRTWLTYVSIVAALLAGMAGSTAFADGKKGSKSQSGNSFRSMSGGNGGGNGGGNSQIQRKLVTPSQGFQAQGFQSQQLQGMSGVGNGLNPVKKPQLQFSPAAGNGISGAVLGNGNKPKLHVTPSVGNAIGNGILGNGNKPQIQVKPAISNAIGTAVLGNSTKQQLKLSPALVGTINPAIIGGTYCGPIGCNPSPCNPCFNPCNKWCGPCWWWSPCWDPCYHSCFYPSIYCYPQPIVITAPVATTVVTTGLAPAVTVQPVEKLLQIPVGATVTLQGKDLGDKPGMLVVQIDKVSLPAQVNEWKPDSANVTLPMIGLSGPTKAQLWMVKADGAVAANMAVELLPAEQPANFAAAPMGEVK